MARRRMLSRRRLLQSTRAVAAVAAAERTRAKPVPGSERTDMQIERINNPETVADIGQLRDKMTT
jgi:hypothetical protein